jgi:hypothetical protein
MGLTVGFGVGYYLGARAGRERYVQMNDMLRKIRRSQAYDVATEKAREAVEAGVEATKDFVDEHRPGHQGNGVPSPISSAGF